MRYIDLYNNASHMKFCVLGAGGEILHNRHKSVVYEILDLIPFQLTILKREKKKKTEMSRIWAVSIFSVSSIRAYY
jgi:hypothetical protein